MSILPDPEELVASYWQRLASSIEGGVVQRFKAQAINGNLRPRSSNNGGRVRRGSVALRNGEHLSKLRGAIRHHVRFQSRSNS
jgi:hypothetical protein